VPTEITGSSGGREQLFENSEDEAQSAIQRVAAAVTQA